MANRDGQIDTPQCGRPKRAELRKYKHRCAKH